MPGFGSAAPTITVLRRRWLLVATISGLAQGRGRNLRDGRRHTRRDGAHDEVVVVRPLLGLLVLHPALAHLAAERHLLPRLKALGSLQHVLVEDGQEIRLLAGAGRAVIQPPRLRCHHRELGVLHAPLADLELHALVGDAATDGAKGDVADVLCHSRCSLSSLCLVWHPPSEDQFL